MSNSKRGDRPDWESLIQQQSQSGQSIKAFCEAQQINRHTFQYWRRKLKSQSGTPNIEGFVSLQPQWHTNDRIRLNWKNELTLDLPGNFPPEALAVLMKQLAC